MPITSGSIFKQYKTFQTWYWCATHRPTDITVDQVTYMWNENRLGFLLAHASQNKICVTIVNVQPFTALLVLIFFTSWRLICPRPSCQFFMSLELLCTTVQESRITVFCNHNYFILFVYCASGWFVCEIILNYPLSIGQTFYHNLPIPQTSTDC